MPSLFFSSSAMHAVVSDFVLRSARGGRTARKPRCCASSCSRRRRRSVRAASEEEGSGEEEGSDASGFRTPEGDDGRRTANPMAAEPLEDGQMTAIVTGAVSVMVAVAYLALVQVMDARTMVPAVEEEAYGNGELIPERELIPENKPVVDAPEPEGMGDEEGGNDAVELP